LSIVAELPSLKPLQTLIRNELVASKVYSTYTSSSRKVLISKLVSKAFQGPFSSAQGCEGTRISLLCLPPAVVPEEEAFNNCFGKIFLSMEQFRRRTAVTNVVKTAKAADSPHNLPPPFLLCIASLL
jgi:hypothetical protein